MYCVHDRCGKDMLFMEGQGADKGCYCCQAVGCSKLEDGKLESLFVHSDFALCQRTVWGSFLFARMEVEKLCLWDGCIWWHIEEQILIRTLVGELQRIQHDGAPVWRERK